MSDGSKDWVLVALIGQPIRVAQKTAREQGWQCRVRRLNGQPTIGTCDFDPIRVNVAVVDNLVTEILGTG